MDVEQPSLPSADEPGRQQPHEPSEAYQIDAMGFEHRLQGALKCFTIVAEGGVIDDGSCDAFHPRPLEARRVGTV